MLISQKLNILITGGAGYKGSSLVPILIQNNKVDVLDQHISQESTLIPFTKNKNFNFIKKDIYDIKKSDLTKYDLVIHLAGLSGYPACEANPGIAESVNVHSTKNLCRLLSKNQKLIYASTTYIYEISKKKINEDSKVNPKTLYAKTKLEAEKICLQRENTVALRFATIFGVSPTMRHDLLLNDFVRRAVNERNIVLFDEHSLRSFIHINDVMDAYILTIKNFNKMKRNIYNIGSDNMNYSKLQIAKKIQKKTHCEIITSSLADPDKRNFIIDYKKIQKFKFTNKVSIDEGISELVKFYKWFKPGKTGSNSLV
jgi:nucleoside-diphosphate-sugar epimerase